MAVFAVVFHIEGENPGGARHSALARAIASEATLEPAAVLGPFTLLETEYSSAELLQRIVVRCPLNEQTDSLLVINLSAKSHAAAGAAGLIPIDRLMNQR